MDKIKDFKINSERWLSLEDFDGEKWKPIKGFEDLYCISNYARIKSCRNQQILKPYLPKTKHPYWIILLYNNGKTYRYRLHRLVAEAFVENPHNYPIINHKDENTTNPCAVNLEWCTYKYNSNYGTLPERMRQFMLNGAKFRRVHKYTLEGEYVESYDSQKIAGEVTGINPNSICGVCKEKDKFYSAGGYLWTYTKNESEIRRKLNRFINSKRHGKHEYRIKVAQYSLDNKFIKYYDSINQASQENKILFSSIYRCVIGKRKKAGGYIWRKVT